MAGFLSAPDACSPEVNRLQTDYARYPKSCRGSPAVVAIWEQAAAAGHFDYTRFEAFWAQLQPYLLSKGYTLRPRYAPGWKPRWFGTDIDPRMFEDSLRLHLPFVIDARREIDDSPVAIKWIPDEEDTRDEPRIMRFLSSDSLKVPQNHCNPLLDTFPHPDSLNGVFVVTPWLASLTWVPLQTVSDVVDMMLQLFEGLAFMHENGVAHRDCTGMNVMQDATSLFPGERMHPLEPDCTEDLRRELDPRPRCVANVRYYFIDFGTSSHFAGPGPHLVTGTICRDQAPPELSDSVPYDPFKLDVFLMGNFFLQKYLKEYSNLDFLRPLLLEMTRSRPDDRPSAQVASDKLKLFALQPPGVLFRWRLRRRDEDLLSGVFGDMWSLQHEVYLQVRHVLVGGNTLSFGRPRL